MDKIFVMILLCVVYIGGVISAPKIRVIPQQERKPLITGSLPANWTNIRDEVADTFSCEGKGYGYYADVDNDCQVFHVCLPVEGRKLTYRWSFICPGDTIFNQQSFTCTRSEDSVRCDEAPDFYNLNDNFGLPEEDKEDADKPAVPNAIDASAGSAEQPDARRKSRKGQLVLEI